MVPRTSKDSIVSLNSLFGCACSLMSRLMRDMVINSLRDVVSMFEEYKVNFSKYYHLMATTNTWQIHVNRMGTTTVKMFLTRRHSFSSAQCSQLLS